MQKAGLATILALVLVISGACSNGKGKSTGAQTGDGGWDAGRAAGDGEATRADGGVPEIGGFDASVALADTQSGMLPDTGVTADTGRDDRDSGAGGASGGSTGGGTAGGSGDGGASDSPGSGGASGGSTEGGTSGGSTVGGTSGGSTVGGTGGGSTGGGTTGGSTGSGASGGSTGGGTTGGSTGSGASGGSASGGASGNSAIAGASGGSTTGGVSGSSAIGGATGGSASGGASGGSTASDCSTTLVAPQRGGGDSASATYSPSGELHVVYVDATDRKPRHAFRDSGGLWHNEIVDATVGRDLSSQATGNPSIRVAHTGEVHVSYMVSGGSMASRRLRYAIRSVAGSWSAPQQIGYANLQALGIDGSDKPFIVWDERDQFGYFNYRLMISRPSQDGFSSEAVDTWPKPSSGFWSISDISTAVDGAGKPWIAVIGSSAYLYAPQASGFARQRIAPGSASQLCINAAGTTAYVPTVGGVGYGLGEFWTTESIWSTSSTKPYIWLDDKDTAFAAYTRVNGSYTAVHTYRRDAEVWTLIDQSTFTSAAGSSVQAIRVQPVAVDPRGRPALFDDPESKSNLRMIEFAESGPISSDIDVKQSVGSLGGHAVDADGRLMLAYYADFKLQIARERAGGGFDLSSPDLPGTFSAVTLTRDRKGRFCMAGYNGTSILLATFENEQWTVETVGQSADAVVSGAMGLVFSAENAPHVFYPQKALTNPGLWHLTTGSNPGPHQVDSAWLSGDPLHPLVDGQGKLYVVYTYVTTVLAQWTGLVWQKATLGNTNSFGSAAAVDGAGRACVAYPAAPGPSLGLACVQNGSLVYDVLAPSLSYVYAAEGDGNGALHVYAKLNDGTRVLSKTATGVSSVSAPDNNPNPDFAVGPDGKFTFMYLNPDTKRIYTSRCR